MCETVERGLPGLAIKGLSDPEQSGEASCVCFEAGRQTQTQSSVMGFCSKNRSIPETANGCLVLRTAGTLLKKHNATRLFTLHIHCGGLFGTSTGQLRLPLDFA
jgi:hypothetical protein